VGGELFGRWRTVHCRGGRPGRIRRLLGAELRAPAGLQTRRHGHVTPPAAYTPPVLNPPPNFGDEGMHEVGEARYDEHCNSCHGGNVGRVSNIFPDLRYAAALSVPELFKAIVIDGALQADGMVSFKKVLTMEDAEAIRSYVVTLANQAKNAPPAPALHQWTAPLADLVLRAGLEVGRVMTLMQLP